jgi:hypothetical protein
MDTIPVRYPDGLADAEVASAIEAAASAEGLVVRLRGALGKYPGSRHWHLGRPGARGTLEVTWWPREAGGRLWLAMQAGRRAPWISQAIPRLLARLEVGTDSGDDGNGSAGRPITTEEERFRMNTLESLEAVRLERWCQTPATRIADPAAAEQLIQRVGLATLYPVSPEVPDLFHAYIGDPAAQTDSKWDSPSGEVYTWRWVLGRRAAAFYTALVRGRPTWVSWALMPAVLCLCGELRTPDELTDAGVLSRDAYRVARALEESSGDLSTGELREAAGFPTGKEHRAAYLKAVQELETQQLLAKVFSQQDEETRHALVATRYPDHVATAARLPRERALDQLLAAYLPHAVYAVPGVLARHLRLREDELRAGLERLVASGHAEAAALPARKGACYVWRAERLDA